jgi:hypothetical protein
MKKLPIKHITKQLPIIGRPLIHSLISDATIYNFKENRECIRHYFTWRIHAFLDLKMDNTQLIKRILFLTEDLDDDSISESLIEEFRWGHYVEFAFIEKVNRLLSSIEYDEDSDDIVVLLLMYKHFLQFTYMDVDNSWDFGDLDLIKWMLKYGQDNFPTSSIVVYPKGLKTEFSRSATSFIHGLILEFLDSGRLKDYVELRNEMLKECSEVRKLVANLQGSDRGRKVEFYRRKVVRILYLSFRNSRVAKKEKLFVVGELISLVDGYNMNFKSETYNDLQDFYFKRLRSYVSDLDKVQFDQE